MTGSAATYLPDKRSLRALRTAAASCQGCGLYRDATQTVFGKGRAAARVMLVGEQPGDREDVDGEPFVGPAGRLLRAVLDEIDVDTTAIYLTNVVKHFSFRPAERGKRRIHQRPRASEISACRPWFAGELAAVQPELVVCLGAIAATAVAGSGFRLTRHRGAILPRPESVGEDLPGDWSLLATVHPAAVLRAPDRHRARQEFTDDLRMVAQLLAGS